MTKTHETLRNRARRYVVGLGSAALLLGAGTLMTLGPTAQEPLVTVPASQWLGLTVTQTARDAYVHAMLQSGWELTAPVRADDV